MTLGLAINDVELFDGGAVAYDAWQKGWTPPPIKTVSEWADEHRRLPREAASEPGRWRTSRMPFLREIMDDLSVHSPVTEVGLKKSTQVGGTEIALNFLGYMIDHAPGPGMYVLPTLPVARNFSDQRLQPMIDLMPVLSAKIGARRSRDGGNTTLMKKFPAGFWVLAGANSANSLASMPIKFLLLDELSKYPDDVDEQGDAATQAVRRTSSFTSRKKIFRVSSPTVKDACAITADYESGTMAQYHVPCPHCLKLQVLVIDQLTDDGQFVCIHCGQLIDEKHKSWMLREAGHSDDGLAKWVHRRPERKKRTYEVWCAYAGVGLGYTWKEIADFRREAKEKPEKEVTFYNTILGDAYEGAAQRIDAEEVSRRAGKWLRRTIPRGCLILIGSVDVQANRFSLAIWGFGRGERAWLIDTVELSGDPTRQEDWSVVDEYFATPITNSCGISMRAERIAVDSGNWTKEVYDFVRPRQVAGFIAIKGMRSQDHPLIARPRKEDSNQRGRVDRSGLRRWNIGVTTAKTTLMQRLLKDGELAEGQYARFHFPADLESDFYEQLTAERFDLVARRWIKPSGRRNEELDKLVYAYAVACSPMVRINVMRESDWGALEAKLEPAADLFSTSASPAPPIGAPARAPTLPAVSVSSPPVSAPPAPLSDNPFASTDWMSRR